MKNNRGQVLIVFVLMLPALFMLVGLIIDSGFLFIDKRKVDYAVVDAIEYGLDNLDDNLLESKIRKILNANIDDIKSLKIVIDNDEILVNLKKEKSSIFTLIYSKHTYEISTIYRGYNNNGKAVIRKE